jgi:hypothetical protein
VQTPRAVGDSSGDRCDPDGSEWHGGVQTLYTSRPAGVRRGSRPAASAVAAPPRRVRLERAGVVYPLVYRRAVSLSALTTIVAVLIASLFLGVGGAIFAVPSAAVT